MKATTTGETYVVPQLTEQPHNNETGKRDRSTAGNKTTITQQAKSGKHAICSRMDFQWEFQA